MAMPFCVFCDCQHLLSAESIIIPNKHLLSAGALLSIDFAIVAFVGCLAPA